MRHSDQSRQKQVSDIFPASRLKRLFSKLGGGYNYDVTDSYSYAFDDSAAVIRKVEMEQGRIQLPPSDGGFHTAFLKGHIKTSFLGRFIHPCIEIDSGGQSEIQYFERGGRGIRYINISSFLGEEAPGLTLRGKHVEIEAGSIELMLFGNAVPRDPTVLVIAPHPDDAEIAAYGFYSDIENTYIVTVTAGDAGTYNYNKIYRDRAEHSLKKGELRTWNSITVPMLCGIPPERSLNLGFFETDFREMYNNKDRNVCSLHAGISDINTFRKQNLSSLADELDGTANWNSLVANLARLIERIKPDIIVAPHPVLDAQENHRFSSIAVFEAVKKAELKDGQFYFYTNHIKFNHLYPYGRMGSMVSLPPSFGRKPYFKSIHSHQLSVEKQKDKMLSLEAMTDLRFNADRKFSKDATMAMLKAPFKDALGFDDSYYRRAARRNELFFVVEVKDVYDKKKLALLTGMGCDVPGAAQSSHDL